MLSSRKVCLNSCPLPRTPLNCILGSVSRLQSLDPDAGLLRFLLGLGSSQLREAPVPGISRSPTLGSPCWGVAFSGRVTACAKDLWKKLREKNLKMRNYFFF